ncbi:MAG: sugar phosphate isomerase/epimerase, partial [Chloroflexia bacterium]|nr:sugar phosphate isomerase/epimerase [Chloroflexia bacterium]
DTFHMNIEEKDQAAAIRLVGSTLAHFHACGNDRGAPGADHIAWDAITAALGETGYDGAVVIESFTPDNQTIARAAAIWRPLARSQDALATDGLAFLRGRFAWCDILHLTIDRQRLGECGDPHRLRQP